MSQAELTFDQAARVENLQVIVKEETPFLPKVAFTLITLASLGGATFTGLELGMDKGISIVLRWLTLWSLALAGGFLVWRVCYLRRRETQVDQARLDALNASAFDRADLVARYTAGVVALGALGALVVPVLGTRPLLRGALVAGSLVLAALLAAGVRRYVTAIPAALVVLALIGGWAYTDVGADWWTLVRMLHLSAFALWLGGALWNIGVAMPVGRDHANVDAVMAQAHQLDRFRWVVRFALPTIIITGVAMATRFSDADFSWWVTFPGVLIPLKVMAIIALVVVFITCPLFRHCSPVQGVCNVDDLEAEPTAMDGVSFAPATAVDLTTNSHEG